MAKKNLFKMLQEQASTGREVLGAIVVNKVDGNKNYSVTEVNSEEGYFVVTEVLPPDAEEVAKSVKLTNENCAAFSYERNPNPKPTPEATADNGVLIVGGKKIIMGAIKADRVLGGCKGRVLFLNNETVMSYDVQFDKFETVGEIKDKDAKLYLIDNMALLVENIFKEVPQMDKDGNPILDENGTPVIKIRYADTVISQCEGGFIRPISFGEDYDCDDCDDCYDCDCDCCDCCENEDSLPIGPVEFLRLVQFGRRKAIVAVHKKEVDEKGYLTGEEAPQVTVIRTDGYNVYEVMATFPVKSADAKVYLGGRGNSETITIVSDTDFILKDDYGIKCVEDEDIVSAMQGYKYFCSETAASTEDGTEVTITFANDAYEVKSFKVLKTKDRGDIYSL